MRPDRLGPLGRDRLARLFLSASGALGAAAYPDLDWWVAGWVWLVPLLALSPTRSPREALAGGWLQGTVFFVVLLRWLDHTFRHYSAIPWPITWLPIVALAAYCGLYVGLVSGAVAWLSRALGAGLALALAPPLWVAGEWVRGHLMGGFPWGLLGYSQHRVLPVLQIAEFTGVYGVSFLLCAVNSALAAALALGWRRAAPGVAACVALLGISLGFGWHALEGQAASPGPPSEEIRVSVIQPSVEQSLKWNPAHHAATMALYERLTREAAASRPALILWPETAATIFLRGDPALLGRLTGLSRDLGTPIVVGSIDRAEGVAGRFRNSAFFLTEQGVRAKYDKIHLVPFGEYVPLAWLLGFVRTWAEFISDFEAGRERVVLPLPGAPFGTVICYEVIFPELFREFVGGGALFMANITNDAWFGTTSGPWQHLGMLALRAVENRVAIARAANTGVSAFVEPSGRVAGILPLFERGVLGRSVPLRRGATVYTRFGDWFAYACLGLSGGALALGIHRRGLASCSAS